MERGAELLIGSPKSEFLRISPVSCSDREWLHCQVELRVGAFSAAYQTNVRAVEFKQFREELAPVYESLIGRAEFQPLEQGVCLAIVGDGLGHFVATCKARDDPAFGSSLRFELRFDQTYLPEILRGLTRIEEQFCTTGTPAA
jgi:hypothetical protein